MLAQLHRHSIITLNFNVNIFVGLWIGLPGCSEELDSLVKTYFRSDKSTRNDLLAQAEALAEKEDYTSKESAKMYAKYMSKIAEKKSDGFVDEEAGRVEKLLQGKLSDQKLEQLRTRSNILTSFKAHKEKAKQDGSYVDAFAGSGEL